MTAGIFGGFGDAAYAPDRTRVIAETVSARLRREMVGRSVFGDRVVVSNGVPERINPSWMVGADRPAPISGFGEVDAQGFEKAPIMPGVFDTLNRPVRCGIYERNITWDKNWPCDTMDRLRTAVVAYLRWRGTDSKGANYIQEEQSMQPNGIEPYGKDWWITSICNGEAPLPEGFPMPDACEEPKRQELRKAAELAKTQAVAIAQSKLFGKPAPATIPRPVAPPPVVAPPPLAPPAPASKLPLFLGIGVAVAAIGAVVMLQTKKGGAPAPKAA